MQNAERRMQNAESASSANCFHRSAFCILRSAFCVLLFATGTLCAQIFTDDFNGSLKWEPHPSDGVSLIITQEPAGRRASALRMDFDFHGHGGYAIARRAGSIDLPADFEFSFWIRGTSPPNNLEFKVIDDTSEQ